MENHLNRELRNTERIKHLNGNKLDNRIENLLIIESKMGNGQIRRNGKFITKHRVIMEEFLKRKLSKDELIYHKDGNLENNEISNLEIVSKSEHGKRCALRQNRDNRRFC